ncbi:MAG: hypothetical protein JRN21_04815 [Nitrososphaerota archaeon]|nr:hypothetical protein [Nitrososphaerota archaeon]
MARTGVRALIAGAYRDGRGAVIVLMALNAVFVALALSVQTAAPGSGPSPSPPGPVPWIADPSIAVVQVLVHVVTGFLVGALTLDLEKGVIGAAMGALIDIDHVSVLLGFTSVGREGHSFVLMAVLIVVVWRLGLWRWGPADFALFAVAQFAAHFAVAPPGFPLFEPFTYQVFSLPPADFAAVAALSLGCFWGLKALRHRAPLREGQAGPHAP